MRISDWSSDVCSSDLAVGAAVERADIPGLSLEKVGIAPEDRAEIVEHPIVEHAIAQRTCGVRRGGPARIGTDRVIVVISRHHRNGQLTRTDRITLGRASGRESEG